MQTHEFYRYEPFNACVYSLQGRASVVYIEINNTSSSSKHELSTNGQRGSKCRLAILLLSSACCNSVFDLVLFLYLFLKRRLSTANAIMMVCVRDNRMVGHARHLETPMLFL